MNNRMEYKYGDRNVRDRYIRDERDKRDKDRWLKMKGRCYYRDRTDKTGDSWSRTEVR